jgi:hypothetical protein
MKNLFLKAFVGLSLLGLGLGAYYHPPKQNVVVSNKLKTIEVISLLETEQAYELVLKNVSNKRINGYSISFGNGASRTVDMSVGEKTIAPGEQFKVALPHREDILPPSIRYIVFDDGSGDGDLTGIAELQDRRAGRAEQLNRVLVLLSRHVSTGDVESLKNEIQAMPEEQKGGRSIYYLQGQRNAKEDTLLALEKMDKTKVNDELTRLAEQTSKMLRKISVKQ